MTQLRGKAAVLLGIAAFALTYLAAREGFKVILNVGLKLYLGLVKLPMGFALRLILADGKAYVFCALAGLALLAYAPCRDRLAKTPGWRRLRWGFPLAAALGIASAGALCVRYFQEMEINRYGFYVPFRCNSGPYVLRANRGAAPDMTIQTNSLGFRDEEWNVNSRRGARRVVVVGDSFVWGFGIPDASGMLHRRLKTELDARRAGRWEVLNIANTPAALWYYVQALMAVGEETRPDLYVMSFLGYYDLEPWEVQRVKFGLPSYLVGMMDACGVSHDLMTMGASIGSRFARGAAVDQETLADMRDAFSRLVAFLERTQGRLVVWEGISGLPLLDEYRAHPNILFLGWMDVAELPENMRLGARHRTVDWQKDETLAYRGDGHPTPKANGLIAKTIARGIAARWREDFFAGR